jgi:DNA-binding MarR family transcriptional regulator
MQQSPNREVFDEVFQLLGRIIVRSDPGRLEAMAGLGLTITQLRVLFILRETEGLPARYIAETLRVTPSTLTRIMDRLVREQLITREEDPSDRRLVRHYLTATARDAVEAIERQARERMDKVLTRLTPDQTDVLLEGLGHLAAASETVEAEEAAELKVSA